MGWQSTWTIRLETGAGGAALQATVPVEPGPIGFPAMGLLGGPRTPLERELS